jgi:hypothetical protein
MNPASLGKTSSTARIQKRITVVGYQRKANATHEYFSEVALNIVPNPVFSVTGVLIDFPESDLPALRTRETGYDMVDISHDLAEAVTSPVYTFIAPNTSEYYGKYISSEYLDICLEGVPDNEREEWLLETVIECGISDKPNKSVYRHA